MTMKHHLFDNQVLYLEILRILGILHDVELLNPF